MFTGIIQGIGVIQSIEKSENDYHLYINTEKSSIVAESIGESIAVNGVCLTVTSFTNLGFLVDVSHETLNKTAFKYLEKNTKVNLEKSLTLSTPLSGHLVTGHIDGTGELTKKLSDGQSTRYYFRVPKELMGYIAHKGSITINGISLTINGIDDKDFCFDVSVIPHTELVTNIGNLLIGNKVNLEIDIIARYVARSLETKSKDSGLALDSIRKSGL